MHVDVTSGIHTSHPELLSGGATKQMVEQKKVTEQPAVGVWTRLI